jgi:uncharacterized protein (TIGR03435 family)
MFRLSTLMVLALFAAAATAQRPTAATSFDVATIKPNNTGSGSVGVHSDEGVFNASNVSLRNLLEDAYNIRREQISGIPSQLDSLRFDISAKIVADPAATSKITDDEMRAALLHLLEDRFGLKAHTETRTLPLYQLIVAPGGSKLKPSPSPDAKTSVNVHNNRDLTAKGDPMPDFANELAGFVRRPVIDKTGLPGKFDFELHFTPDDAAPGSSDTLPGLFTALEEQLGLKLQGGKGPVPVLVIDHLELPTAN